MPFYRQTIGGHFYKDYKNGNSKRVSEKEYLKNVRRVRGGAEEGAKLEVESKGIRSKRGHLKLHKQNPNPNQNQNPNNVNIPVNLGKIYSSNTSNTANKTKSISKNYVCECSCKKKENNNQNND